MFEKSVEEELAEQRKRPVECLGMTFDNDDARREHFLAKLREGLEELHQKLGRVPFTTVEDAVQRMKAIQRWPMATQRADGTLDEDRLRELAERMRHAESSKDLLQRWKDEVGFPHGEVQDILNLSDPPYYTACPNPFLADFIRCYGKPYDPKTDNYRREPFAVDVSEGKTDPLYKAHGYHTKVPHLAIVPSILHYTQPGDIVLDGFCGSGMTGVAAQWCGAAPEAYRRALEEKWAVDGWGKPQWGARRVILGDLSPAATFIAANYNIPFNVNAFAEAGRRLLKEVQTELGWM
ncbi:MAG: DNA methylase, partial [Planctomycetes bacterium]|nr:DNA methylase [Planctomycetota bacterium]